MGIDLTPECREALRRFGIGTQILQSVEEFSELITVLLQYRRIDREVSIDSILSEIADAEIMLTQLKIIFTSGDNYDKMLLKKMNKFREFLKKENT